MKRFTLQEFPARRCRSCRYAAVSLETPTRRQRRLRAVASCTIAVALVAAMAGLRYLLDPLLEDHHPFVLFLAAAFLSTWSSGWKAGTLALALGLTLADLMFIHPRGSLLLADVEQRVGLVVYCLVGAVIVALVEGRRRATEHSREQAAALANEVAEHRKAEEALRRAKAELESLVARQTIQFQDEAAARQEAKTRVTRLAAIVASSEDAIIGKGLDGTITDWNLGAQHLFGYTAEEAIGRHASILVPPDRQDEVRQIAKRLLGGEPVPPYETVRLRKDGAEVPVSVRISPIREGGGGRVIGLSSINRDLTRSRQLEHQLRQSQKMEAVGQLAGGIAHDFNNILTVIACYSTALLDELYLADEDTRLALAEIRLAGERAAALTRQLLVFSRRGAVQPEVMDLNDTVRGVEKMLRRLIGADVRLAADLAADLNPIYANPGQVEQVIMNLVVNARDAMPTGGRLIVETATVDLGEGYARCHPGVWPGRHVLLRVADTGTGMDEATRARMFEPFFTTKEVGKGTGLGLAVVHGIVKQAGGHIDVESEPGRGTRFDIYWPVAQSRQANGPSKSGERIVAGGVETVLLVEDDESIRRLAGRALRKAGYQVLEAAQGAEAAQVARRHDGPIHLLLTDVVMPEMGGRALAEHVAGIHPGVAVVFMSGYLDDTVLRSGVQIEEVAFLQKPFTPAGLTAKVRAVLDGRASQVRQ